MNLNNRLDRLERLAHDAGDGDRADAAEHRRRLLRAMSDADLYEVDVIVKRALAGDGELTPEDQAAYAAIVARTEAAMAQEASS